MKSKYCLLALVLLLVSDIKGQKSAIDRYYEELKASTTIYDTIASVLSLKIAYVHDKEQIVKPLQTTLLKTYPTWINRETAKIRTQIDSTNVILPNEALNQYFTRYSYLENIIARKESTVQQSLLDYQPKNEADKLIKYFLLTRQYTSLGEDDEAYEIAKNLYNKKSKRYPILQLNIIVDVLYSFFPKLPQDSDEIFNWAESESIRLNEYNDRALLYNVKQVDRKNAGDIEGSMQFGLKFVEATVKGENYQRAVTAYCNLAMYHQEQGNIKEAYRLIEEGAKIARENGLHDKLIETEGAKAFVKMNQREYREAINILKSCLEYEELSINTQVLFTMNIIDSYHAAGVFDSAYYYYTTLLELDPKDVYGYHNYAKTFVIKHLINTNQYNLAKKYIKDAYTDAEAYNDLSSKSNILLAEAELLTALGDFKGALTKFKEHSNIEMDFRNEEKASAVTAAQMTSDFENEKKILAITAENEKLAIAAQRNTALMFGGGSLLLALLSGYFYYTVRRKNQQINAQNQELETLNNTKNTLFQIIGHDLKKPTIAFRNVSNNINYLLQKEDYKRLQALGEEVDHDAKSLYMLTDSLFNWALMQKDSIHLKIEPVDVTEVVEENIKLFNNVASRKNIDIINGVKASIKALVDRNAIDTIIRNLIDNAIKFTKDGGKVKITAVEKEGMVQIEVKDTGTGFSSEVLDAFNQGNNISSQKGTADEKGSGIGLQLVKNLIIRNKGSIDLVNKEDGVSVKILLPTAA